MTDGYVGFDVMRGRVPLARVEVASGEGDQIHRVAVVSSSHSPLAVAAGMVDASTMLEFPAPAEHLCQLQALRADLQSGTQDVGYVPTAEFCVTRGFDELWLDTSNVEDAHRSKAVWEQTSTFMKDISRHAADCIDLHADAELGRVGAAGTVEHSREWRRYVA
jgi:hypothetical protein